MINFDFGLKFFQIDLVVKVGTHEGTSFRISATSYSLQLVPRRVYKKGLVAGPCPTNTLLEAF